MSGIQRFLTKRGERHRRSGKHEKEPQPTNPGVRSYLRGLVIKKRRLASIGILDLNTEQINGALTSPYAQGDTEKAFDLLMMIEDSIEGILRDHDTSIKLVGAVNRMGVTCYLDALLFAMFARLDFFEAILYRPFTDNNDPRRKLVILLRLWVNMLRSGKLITTDITEHLQEALSECGWPEAAKLCQQDASEAFTFITEKLELPLLTLKMDIYHTGKEDVADDHKFINERLLEVAIPPEHEDGTPITLEECLEAYFNNKIEVKRYLERRGTVNSMRSFDSTMKAATVHVESVEVGSAAPSPIRTGSPKIEFPITEKVSASSTLTRRPSIVQERFIPDKDSFDDLVHGRKRKGSYRKEVMMPAWQFFSLIPWYTDNTPINDAQVAAHFSSKRPILGMCLKRYSVLPNGNAIRLNTFIDIPTEIGLPHFIQDDKLDEDGPLYGNFKLSLQSVVCHRGNSVDSGHYVALVRGTAANMSSTSHSSDTNSVLSAGNSEPWMRFDDLAAERITRVNIEEALKEESPYLLFYQIVPIDDSLTEENLSDKRVSFISGSEELHDDPEKEIIVSTTHLEHSADRNTSSSARLSFDLSSLRPTLDISEIDMSSEVQEGTMIEIMDGPQNGRTGLRDAFTTRRSLSIPRRSKESRSRSRSRGGDQSGEKRLSALSRFTSRISKEKGIDSPSTTTVDQEGRPKTEDGTIPSIAYDETETKQQLRGRDSTLRQSNGKQRQRKEKSNPDRECLVM
ncbi:ubiquitin C-terminal hydrolase family protein [Talaromyces stipitatus ATCC 10500]|uniref:ubiquitinyl hydrolase 1 n=1 Tax=Talaromyces stipitatus (strain ATCC 10500 / CBS 375.48 / QM 6759 / NRRL 1006) TaxID=441959 RepID=B8MRA4_TALSN|nr:ubiquitin C-terminal hydrolase family protein [Talaromyces stipitatus ATCC 10500]EED12999.1 ubiquitin C-terminal hydrolase family protein [Talaromyces stipitatus ATCC 10500]